MPMWRCPHCGTPQAETARCWVCRRSSTACGTCRNFRRSVAGSLGYCGLDRSREPLAGDEIRPCWEAWSGGAHPTLVPPSLPGPATAATSAAPARAAPLEFVEVSDRPAAASAGPAKSADAVDDAPPFGHGPLPPVPGAEPGWSLWGDLDR